MVSIFRVVFLSLSHRTEPVCSPVTRNVCLETFVLSVAWQLLYVLFIAALWGMVQMTQLFSVAKSTTLVNVAHGVVSGTHLRSEIQGLPAKYPPDTASLAVLNNTGTKYPPDAASLNRSELQGFPTKYPRGIISLKCLKCRDLPTKITDACPHGRDRPSTAAIMAPL